MLRLVEKATTEAMSIDEIKLRLRMDDTPLDSEMESMIAAARGVVERQTGYALVEAIYDWYPVSTSYRYLPIEPATIVSDEDQYPIRFKTNPGKIVPDEMKAAITLIVGDLLKNTEASADKAFHDNPAVQNLIFPFRRVLP